jgi:type IV secretion system protein TrbB
LTEYKKRINTKIVRELGETIMSALNDDDVIEVMLNSDGLLWVEKIGKPMEHIGELSAPIAKSVIETIASYYDDKVTSNHPILECELPIDGSRFEALIPPVVVHPTFTIRKKATKIFTLSDYVKSEIITQSQKELLEQMILERKNILVVGGTSSGKTTLCNAIIHSISNLTPDHRMVIIEDTAELQCSAKNQVILRATAEVNMLKLLRATMRLRPDRILVGEVRGGEALNLLKSWNTGHPGGIATVHANSAQAGLIRLEQLIAEATSGQMQELIAEAIDVVVFIARTAKGREIKQIIQVDKFDLEQRSYNYREIK